MTLREVLPMAAARWEPYAMLLAQNYNFNCASASKTIEADTLNPYKPKPKRVEIELPREALEAALKQAFR